MHDEMRVWRGEIANVPKMTDDEVLDLRERLMFAVASMRKLKGELDAAMIEYIEVRGDIPIGDGGRLYVGNEKRTKCSNQRACVEALIEAADGDLDTFCEMLGSSAIKHGAARGLLGDTWTNFFTVENVPDLKTGKAKRSVLEYDPRYSKGTQ